MAESPDRHPRDQLARELSLRDATMLVVSGVIGSGIFLTPAAIATQIPFAPLIFALSLSSLLLFCACVFTPQADMICTYNMKLTSTISCTSQIFEHHISGLSPRKIYEALCPLISRGF